MFVISASQYEIIPVCHKKGYSEKCLTHFQCLGVLSLKRESESFCVNRGAAGCCKFAAKPLLAYFKIISQSINSKNYICKLLTFPAFEYGDKSFSKLNFRFT